MVIGLQIALFIMSEFYQLACPFCGRNRPLTDEFRLGELTIPPAEYGIITVRQVGAGPGRGHIGESTDGLRTIGRLNITEAMADSQFSDISGQVKDRLLAIIRSYLDAGAISLEEITG